MKTTTNPLLPDMPVLEDLHESLGGLEGSVGVFCGLQHLFGSTASLVRRLTTGCVPPKNVFLLGKPYSTSPAVANLLRNDLGYWVHPDSTDQPTDVENDALMDRRIITVLDRAAAASSTGRVLLIDDGGRAIKLLHDHRYDAFRAQFTCVEQTRCGIRAISSLDLEVPVVNVAESPAKLRHESPLIAASVVVELQRKLRGLAGCGLEAGRRALVIGYGAIGSAVADQLRNTGRTVTVFDRDRLKQAAARIDGFAIGADLRSELRKGGIIVGCTGLPALDVADYDFIGNGSLLISASSADVEFKAWHLRGEGKCLGDPSRWQTDGEPDFDGVCRRWDHPCFSLYQIQRGSNRFFLVNGGFPVNFNGGVDPIEPGKIQLTRSLLYLAGVQASQTGQPGLHPLDLAGQEHILRQLYLAPVVDLAA